MSECPPTADLCDANIGDNLNAIEQHDVRVMEPVFRSYGGATSCCGQAFTIRCFESNVTVGEVVKTTGQGRVLVVDAGGSTRVAMLGDNLAAAAVKNGWVGVIMYGCIRDSAPINMMPLCVRALNTYPVKSTKTQPGQIEMPIKVAGVLVRQGDWVYVDSDGIVVSTKQLSLTA